MGLHGPFIGRALIEEKTRTLYDIRQASTQTFIFHANRLLAAGQSLIAFALLATVGRIRVAIGNDRIKGHAIKQVLRPWATGQREPRRVDKLADEGKTGMRRQQDVAFSHQSDLVPQTDIETVGDER